MILAYDLLKLSISFNVCATSNEFFNTNLFIYYSHVLNFFGVIIYGVYGFCVCGECNILTKVRKFNFDLINCRSIVVQVFNE